MELEKQCKMCEGKQLGYYNSCYHCKDGFVPTEEGEALLSFIQKYLCIRKYEDYGNNNDEDLSRK